jgi:hypothetical protein
VFFLLYDIPTCQSVVYLVDSMPLPYCADTVGMHRIVIIANVPPLPMPTDSVVAILDGDLEATMCNGAAAQG